MYLVGVTVLAIIYFHKVSESLHLANQRYHSFPNEFVLSRHDKAGKGLT